MGIAAQTKISPRTIDAIFKRAKDAGFDPEARPLVIRDTNLQDLPRTGRPNKRQIFEEAVLAQVRKDRYSREKTCADIAAELSASGRSISATTVWLVLRNAGLRKVKPTRKPGLTEKMRKERYEWCLARKDWTLEDWKNVIWSDETSVVLLHRRGGYRIWRRSDEKLLKTCIRERWKGSSEFMFWGCFSYDKKGPCHCWQQETIAEKRASEKAIEALNEQLEPQMRAEWELVTPFKRLRVQANVPGKKPGWRWNAKTGKLGRSSRGGIDWWRYQQCVLIPKLLPFAKVCLEDRPGTLVQEDKAPAHNHHYQQQVYDLYSVQRLLWCGNSPDLNAIEPAWPYLKRVTTRKGAPSSRADAIRKWEAAWKELPQERIQAWIERLPYHIAKIIELRGGNEYQEGR